MERKSKSGGVGFMGLLALLFIGLKLTGHIGWSWLWVTAPIWGPLVMVSLAIIGAVVYALLSDSSKGT